MIVVSIYRFLVYDKVRQKIRTRERVNLYAVAMKKKNAIYEGILHVSFE